jgi:hypothetical protein
MRILTTCSRPTHQKMTVIQGATKFAIFMGYKIQFPSSQQPTTDPGLEPDKVSPRPHTKFSNIRF